MEQKLMNKKEVVHFFLKRGLLLNSECLEEIRKEDNFDGIYNLLNEENTKEILVLTNDTKKILDNTKISDVNWNELEKLKVLFEKGKNTKNYQDFINYFLSEEKKEVQKEERVGVKVIYSFEEDSKKRDASDFAKHFFNRYNQIEKILTNRQELRNITSISRVINKKDKETISIIGLVDEKVVTKNNNIILTLEDKTGHIKVLVNKNKPSLLNLTKDLVLDEVIGVTGVNGENIVFANEILLPDIPHTIEVKKAEDEVYALFVSDLHVGSTNFLEDEFNKFLKWIRGEVGNKEQRQIASKVKYIFIIGDLVDGCGVYPGQEKELLIKDIREQYIRCSNLLKKIPQHINLIICPGNHDAMCVAEPQVPFYEDFAKTIYELPNSTIVSNPAMVNIHSSHNFNGFDVLLYHGYSFDYYIAEVNSLRNKGGYNRADLVMKFLLQKRHLAPTHTSNLYIPDVKKDPLVIDKIPDFFVSGHIHKAITSNYRNVTLICSSCWQSKTSFQEKVGHNPEPSRVPIVNLKTREVKILKFGK